MTQITLRELLREDPIYKQWFMKVPKITVAGNTPPWRLFVQMEEGGRWATAILPSYPKAYAALKLRLPDLYDATIHSRRQHFAPPVVRIGDKKHRMPMPEGHEWCELCRRPVVFKYFSKHPNLGIVSHDYLRCTICGMRQVAMKRYRSRLSWPAKSAKQ